MAQTGAGEGAVRVISENLIKAARSFLACHPASIALYEPGQDHSKIWTDFVMGPADWILHCVECSRSRGVLDHDVVIRALIFQVLEGK